ncbi:DUF2637 domain-containing protein [Amycolatopsis sp. CA-230715]|uniref:DUF2637 domain-containing protein n=1 Tax=Amycolatopsis sp. CA-230715 TaxID=2745196 RepID=UPI001C017BE3|nr:DUF2637 domain-containing protein [Amycolatopsis sp. CA-230715]
MARVSVESAVRLVIATVVGGIGAAAGFTHTHEAATLAGQKGWLAWADAVGVECMVVVAGLQLRHDRAAGKTGLTTSLGVLVVAFLVQMGAQVATAPKTFPGWLFAALPALCCLVVVKFALGSTTDNQREANGEAAGLRAGARRETDAGRRRDHEVRPAVQAGEREAGELVDASRELQAVLEGDALAVTSAQEGSDGHGGADFRSEARRAPVAADAAGSADEVRAASGAWLDGSGTGGGDVSRVPAMNGHASWPPR